MSGAGPRRLRSKTTAAWLAVLLGAVGVHRLYLHGPRDVLAWLHPLPTLVGLAGAIRMRNLGQDDPFATWLVPLLGVGIAWAMATAIWYGLMADTRWDALHNAGRPSRGTNWRTVLAVVLALLVGGGVLMGTITYTIQKLFEWQLAPG